jgi:hypothetical protein
MPGRTGFEGQRQVAELRGEAFTGIAGAGVAMDEDGTGGRIPVQPRKRIVGEEDPVLLAFAELLEAEAAGAVSGRPFDVGRMAVAGSFQGLPHFLGESLGDGDDVVSAHGSPLRLSNTFAAQREPYPVLR